MVAALMPKPSMFNQSEEHMHEVSLKTEISSVWGENVWNQPCYSTAISREPNRGQSLVGRQLFFLREVAIGQQVCQGL